MRMIGIYRFWSLCPLIDHSFKKKCDVATIRGIGRKARAATLEQIKSALDAKTRPYILATGSFIGERFDFPALDTLVILSGRWLYLWTRLKLFLFESKMVSNIRDNL